MSERAPRPRALVLNPDSIQVSIDELKRAMVEDGWRQPDPDNHLIWVDDLEATWIQNGDPDDRP